MNTKVHSKDEARLLNTSVFKTDIRWQHSLDMSKQYTSNSFKTVRTKKSLNLNHINVLPIFINLVQYFFFNLKRKKKKYSTWYPQSIDCFSIMVSMTVIYWQIHHFWLLFNLLLENHWNHYEQQTKSTFNRRERVNHKMPIWKTSK